MGWQIMGMRILNPAVRLPAWPCLERLNRWRLERGILTGRWTQAEVDDINRRARTLYLDLQKNIE